MLAIAFGVIVCAYVFTRMFDTYSRSTDAGVRVCSIITMIAAAGMVVLIFNGGSLSGLSPLGLFH